MHRDTKGLNLKKKKLRIKSEHFFPLQVLSCILTYPVQTLQTSTALTELRK